VLPSLKDFIPSHLLVVVCKSQANGSNPYLTSDITTAFLLIVPSATDKHRGTCTEGV
jgi:hypothetical protein